MVLWGRDNRVGLTHVALFMEVDMVCMGSGLGWNCYWVHPECCIECTLDWGVARSLRWLALILIESSCLFWHGTLNSIFKITPISLAPFYWLRILRMLFQLIPIPRSQDWGLLGFVGFDHWWLFKVVFMVCKWLCGGKEIRGYNSNLKLALSQLFCLFYWLWH